MNTALEIFGEPEAQARPRVFRAGSGVRTHSPKTRWYYTVVQAAQDAAATGSPCLEGPIVARLDFRMRRIKGLPKRRELPHTKKPDCDNLAKAVLDALTPTLIADDRGVVDLRVTKRYALAGERPGCRVELLGQEPAAARKDACDG